METLETRALFSAGTFAAAASSTVTPAIVADSNQPQVTSVNPEDASTDFPLDGFISAEVQLPVSGIDPSTINSTTVFVTRVFDHSKVPAIVNTSGGGDVIVLRPLSPLQPNTVYQFDVTTGVKDVNGNAFIAFSSRFTTGTKTNEIDPQYKSVRFTQVPQANSLGARYLGVTFGPDHKLYASTDDGRIFRFSIDGNGNLSAPQIITTVADHEAGPRYISGMAFDPASTADNLIVWITNNAAGVIGAPDWSGKITRLSGPNLENYQDVITHLPRSSRDHLTEQPSFGPDGALYFSQGSLSSYGDADNIWGNRPEHLLSAAILRLDTSAVADLTDPIDVTTPDGGGTYNPAADGAPLTLYATGVRNAYDLLWHSNGNLYAPTNGSAAGGNVPAGPHSPAIRDVPDAEPDYLFRIGKGGYYGHPNPVRDEFVLNGGNPTSQPDFYEVPEYPVGTQPESNWTYAVYNFGQHESPDGVIEYHGNAFGGVLDHKIIVARYSGGDDLMILSPSADKKGIVSSQIGLPGMTGLQDPLDLRQDPTNGNLYVIEYQGTQATGGRITLLKPAAISTPTPTPTPTPVDTTPPAMVVQPVANITTAGGTSVKVQVNYLDNLGIDPTTIGVDDVTAAFGGTLLSVSGFTTSGTGTSITATYTIDALGGTFDFRDNGHYVVAFKAGAVADTAGNTTAASGVEFDVNITPPPLPFRSRQDLKLITTITTFAARRALTVPDLTYVESPQLKAVYSNLKLEQTIITYAIKHKLSAPDFTGVDPVGLPTIYANLKAQVAFNALMVKVVKLAAKRHYTLPDMTDFAYNDLLVLYQTIRHS